jgi:putative DNA methylase
LSNVSKGLRPKLPGRDSMIRVSIKPGAVHSRWESVAQVPQQLFGRQAIPMTWDFSEANPLGESTGSYLASIRNVQASFTRLSTGLVPGFAHQADAAKELTFTGRVISADPPYYDNIAYADLSDFFYGWLRRTLRDVLPDLFSTLSVPKAEELIAVSHRHGSYEEAEEFFLAGMTQAMQRLSKGSHEAFPITIYYAFKQMETEAGGASASTGWETFLEAVLRSGLMLTGTWPMRMENRTRLVGRDTNALASTIVLVCRPRATGAMTITRSEFLQELTQALRDALPRIVGGEIAPVDLAQASIGPGMAVYSKYSKVLRQDGKPVTVREALQDINNAISAYRTERTSSFDQRTRFCIDFYDQFGFTQADFDNATVLARAQAVGVDTLENEQILVAERGKACLVPVVSYPVGVAGLERGFRGSAWEACMRLTATLQEQGESATAALARQLGEGICARARELAVWLYTIADARKRTQDALVFNALDASWPEIQRHMASMDRATEPGLPGMR